MTTAYTRLRWHPARREWQFSLQDMQGQWGAWAPLNAEFHWHEDERRRAQADARNAFGLRTHVVDFDATSREPENACYADAADAADATFVCPNCSKPHSTNPEVCLLAALAACRGIPITELGDTDIDALWEDLGPVLDKLEDGEYAIEEDV